MVDVLTRFKNEYGKNFRLQRKKVGIITYTNAACNEIIHRLEYDPIFSVKTIHSFSWDIIQNFTNDIKEWLVNNLKNDIAELEEQQSRSRDLTNKTSVERANKIQSKTKRLTNLDSIIAFKYNPNGDNLTKDSLNHAEVISITADLITNKVLLREIVISQFPILLIDESQDTNKHLIEAFFVLQADKKHKFSLGLFGDTMQRIYLDGKERLGENLPSDWIKPAKKMNHRSSKRIIELINTIRKSDDGQEQVPRTERTDGFVRFFLCDRGVDKDDIERRINIKMAEITGDELWRDDHDKHNVKALILEHHMAARRMNFTTIFEPLYKEQKFSTSFLDGTLSGLTFFTNIILPLVDAYEVGDDFSIAQIIKSNSIFFDRDELMKSEDQTENIRKSRIAFASLMALWKDVDEPTLINIINEINSSGLFQLPQIFHDILIGRKASNEDEDMYADTAIQAWELALEAKFSEVRNYSSYLSESSKFGTHQGVKGLEFPRVALIIDDEESRGFLFSYDKLFGAKELTKADKDNISEGKETGIDRTRRLFYVGCSRAKDSLAIIAYTNNSEAVKDSLLKNKWFTESEILQFS